MHKQRNRGQDGSGIASIKMNLEPGTKYINRYRSIQNDSIQVIFNKINKKLSNYNLYVKNNRIQYRDNSHKHAL